MTPYEEAILRARRATRAIADDALATLDRALASWVLEIERELRKLGANTPAGRKLKQSLDALRAMSEGYRRTVRDSVTASRVLSGQTTIRLWAEAQNTLGRLTASSHTAVMPDFVSAGAFSRLGGAHWRTLLDGHTSKARGEVERIILEGLARGASPSDIAPRIRRYIQGADDFAVAFGKLKGQRVDPFNLPLSAIPKELRGEAKRIKYNADRIAASEVNNARAEAELLMFSADPFIVAVKWQTAPNRGKMKPPDICDAYAASNPFGLGAGVWPLHAVPSPPHPWDRCERVPIQDFKREGSEPKPRPKALNPARSFALPARMRSGAGGTSLVRIRDQYTATILRVGAL